MQKIRFSFLDYASYAFCDNINKYKYVEKERIL